MVNLQVFPDAASVAWATAEVVVARAEEAISARGQFAVALSGGSTPRALYTLLATQEYAGRVNWPRVYLFWGDERCVPPDQPSSNYRLVRETLLDHVPIPAENVYRIRGELEPEAAARAYVAELGIFFEAPWPQFDLLLLGLGEDGHTASLFPGSPALAEAVRPAVAVEARYQDRPSYRVTLTLPAINGAREVLFLVAGAAKADILYEVLQSPDGRIPAVRVRPSSGRLSWMVDAAAAALLTD